MWRNDTIKTTSPYNLQLTTSFANILIGVSISLFMVGLVGMTKFHFGTPMRLQIGIMKSMSSSKWIQKLNYLIFSSLFFFIFIFGINEMAQSQDTLFKLAHIIVNENMSLVMDDLSFVIHPGQRPTYESDRLYNTIRKWIKQEKLSTSSCKLLRCFCVTVLSTMYYSMKINYKHLVTKQLSSIRLSGMNRIGKLKL